MAEPGAGPAAERWRRTSELLDAALELAPPLRGRYLDAACAGEAGLRDEVERLLASAEGGGFLDRPAADFAARLLAAAEDGAGAAAPPAELEEGARVGAYRVVRELARGGMGAVYLAERDDPQLRQRVAIKRMHRGLGSAYMIRRFVEERQIVASLDHPGIARLVDGAVTADGVPWFAMEYVEGLPLDLYCRERRLAVDERLELFCQVCDAVQYAHRSLVVHSDLKPSNILVTPAGQPKLLDFGIARITAPVADSAGEAAGEPPAGPRLMTPAYASPEQLRGDPVSTATDVYSLGLLLYLLLVGSHPGRNPAAPSAAAARGGAPEALRRRLRGDLDAVVLRAMHPEPEHRYATAEQLAADLRRHLRDLPVQAHPDGRAYRLRKFVRRNRAGVVASLSAAALLVALGTVSTVQARRVAAERDAARQVEGFVLGLLQHSDLYRGSGRAATVRELLDRGAAQLAAGEVHRPRVRARLFFAVGKAYYSQGEYGRATALLDSSYTLVRALHGPGHPETTAIANQFADVLRVAGRYDRARALYDEVLRARRREFGDGSTEVARSLNGLAMVLRMQGRLAEAEALLREALRTDRRLALAEPTGLPQTLNNLGHVLRERGDLAAAEALHRESLAVRRALWGAEHFEVSVSLGNLAAVLRDRGELAAADSLFLQVLALRSRLTGEDHPDLATDRAGYARLLHRRGELAAAEALYRRAAAVHRAALPAGHLVTAATLLGWGELLLERGRAAQAQPLLEEALASFRRGLPPGHPHTRDAARALDECLAALRGGSTSRPLPRGRHPAPCAAPACRGR